MHDCTPLLVHIDLRAHATSWCTTTCAFTRTCTLTACTLPLVSPWSLGRVSSGRPHWPSTSKTIATLYVSVDNKCTTALRSRPLTRDLRYIMFYLNGETAATTLGSVRQRNPSREEVVVESELRVKRRRHIHVVAEEDDGAPGQPGRPPPERADCHDGVVTQNQ